MPAISGKDYFVCFSINDPPPPNHVDYTNIFLIPSLVIMMLRTIVLFISHPCVSQSLIWKKKIN